MMKQENPNVTKAIEAAKKKKRCRGYLGIEILSRPYVG